MIIIDKLINFINSIDKDFSVCNCDISPNMHGVNVPYFQLAFERVLRRLRKEARMSQEVLGFESELQRNLWP